MDVRRAALSGSWYPGDAGECEKEIASFLKDTTISAVSRRSFVGGIVPHAGWQFSGSIACNVIHRLIEEEPPDVVVIFGMHLHPESPAYIMKEGAWETPFGEIAIEETLAGALSEAFPFRVETTEAYSQDNTIELQLPFIKYFFENARIVPIGVPPRETSLAIGRSVAALALERGLRIKIIGSTDLTHYGRNYGFLPEGSGPSAVDWVRNENDRRMIDIMLEMDPEGMIKEALARQNACCSGAAATALAAGKELGSSGAEAIAYATSYDKHPDDSFVGYAGIVF